ncbi:hypothetical protein, partial [Amycolatopsis mediterranei]|uniref:hypothetical protein n=1 Tax=Amycolatopsis mediterranei TaxID=33910 RepID=UPI00331909AC
MLDSVDNETLPFGGPVERLTRPWRTTLAAELDAVPGLAPDERALVLAAGSEALVQSLHAKLSRVFLIELHARRLTSSPCWAVRSSSGRRESGWPGGGRTKGRRSA